MQGRPPRAQGWFRDPFGRHDARWFSDGFPTGLVRDGGRESRDPTPPDGLVSQPTPLDVPQARSDDMRRADHSDAAGFDAARVRAAVFGPLVRWGD